MQSVFPKYMVASDSGLGVSKSKDGGDICRSPSEMFLLFERTSLGEISCVEESGAQMGEPSAGGLWDIAVRVDGWAGTL